MALFRARNTDPDKKSSTPDAQMELFDHLAELRTRIFRAALYVAGGMVLTYNLFTPIYAILSYPLNPILNRIGGHIMMTNIAQGFLLRMQVAFIAGIVVALPFITGELWGFIKPALTEEERKPVVYLAPFSVLLFLAGLATGYASLPMAYGWMGGYIGDVPGAQIMQDAQTYLLLTVKIILAFGIAFQLPLILLFLARVGILNAGLMTTYWRHAVVGIAILAAILAPSNDPLTMLLMAVPMAGLYILSIGLVRAFEPKEDGRRSPPLSTMLLVALAPLGILLVAGWWLSRPFLSPSAPPPVGPPPTGGTQVRPGNPVAGQVLATDTKGGPAPAAAADDVLAMRRQIEDLRKRLAALEAKNAAPK